MKTFRQKLQEEEDKLSEEVLNEEMGEAVRYLVLGLGELLKSSGTGIKLLAKSLIKIIGMMKDGKDELKKAKII
tara:strand:+ start:211 stop:432 length:222 start_codon:yes stop_codon:yes gene_type:complete